MYKIFKLVFAPKAGMKVSMENFISSVFLIQIIKMIFKMLLCLFK